MVIHGKKISLTTQIFTAMVLGSLAGLIGGKTMVQLGFIGDIWLNCIKMIVIPMVVCTIVTGIISQDNLTSLKRVSRRIITYYVITTVLACIVGLAVATLLQPGHFANFAGLASKKSNRQYRHYLCRLPERSLFHQYYCLLCQRQHCTNPCDFHSSGGCHLEDEEPGTQSNHQKSIRSRKLHDFLSD